MVQGQLFKQFEKARAASKGRKADAGRPGRPEASRKPAGKEAGMTRADFKAHQRRAAGQSPAPVAEPARARAFDPRQAQERYGPEERQGVSDWALAGGPGREFWPYLLRLLTPDAKAGLSNLAMWAMWKAGRRTEQRAGWSVEWFWTELEEAAVDHHERQQRTGELRPDAVAVLLEAWRSSRRPDPKPQAPNLRRDRILSARLAQVGRGDRRGGRLFTPALHLGPWEPGGQLIFPGFGLDRNLSVPALPLAFYELGGGPAKTPGRGAPLAQRLFVEALLTASLGAQEDVPMALEVSLRELLVRLYPGRRPRPNEYWPRLERAALQINTMRRIPFEDPETGKTGSRSVVFVSGFPRGPGCLDESVRLVVDLPPGSKQGPVMPASLGAWGASSAAAYRALIGLRFLWFDPGRTRYPVGKRGHWLQAGDPERYRKLTDSDLVDLCFPISTQQQRRNLVSKAYKTFGRLLEGWRGPPRGGRLDAAGLSDVCGCAE